MDCFKIKMNVVAMRGFNEDEFFNFVEFVKDRKMEVRFIEYMPFDSNQWADSKFIPFFEQKDIINEGLSHQNL